jgi:hypothetical protein
MRTPLSPSRSIRGNGRRRIAVTRLLDAVGAASACVISSPAYAHGFGQRYDLPLPLSLYVSGACAAIVVTFVIVGLFVRDAPRSRAYPRLDLRAYRLSRRIALPGLIFALKLCGLAIFIITVIAGFRGQQDPYRNIAPTMVWIIWWVGLAYVCAFVGNLWALLNPWRTIFEAVETLYCGITNRPALSLSLPYPGNLGVWPAIALLLAFSWTELIYPSPAVPLHIAWLAIGYSILTFLGMFAFGCNIWLERGEVFSLVFGTFARFAPTEQCALRPFGAGLLDSGTVSTSMMAFVLLLLSSVLYDGVLGTPEWGNIEDALATTMPALGDVAFMLIRTTGLFAFWLAFFGAFVAASAIMSGATGARLSPLDMARSFAFTLVPIAIGYHLAHYLTFLLIQGQYIVPLVSDPFGFGWNLFGTSGYRVDIAVVGARFAWFAAVAAILLGHVAAVYLAHLKAMQALGVRGVALRSQVPLTALMVVYTFVSLSILAEPIVERRTPARPVETVATEVNVPDDAMLPEPGSGRLRAIGPGHVAKQKLTYRILGSAFHDGTVMDVADLLYSYMFEYRWGTPGGRSYDPHVDAASSLMRERLVGFKIVGTDTTSKSFRFGDVNFVRHLFVIDLYAAVTPVEPEQDAIFAPPWSTLPWHLIALMEEAVTRGWAAFSQEEAQRREVEWLDLVRSEGMNKRLATLVASFARDGYRPEYLQSLVSVDDARKRWGALAAFYKDHGHFLVTNGPYKLKGWSADKVMLEAFRDLSYPLGVGSYDNYAVPRRGYVTKVEQAGTAITLSGDIELLSKHMRSYDIVRTPLQSVPGDALTRSAPECRYMVTDNEGRVVLAGQVPLAEDKGFHIDLGGKLPPGQFTLLAEIIVNGNALNVDITRTPIIISSDL